MSRPALSQATRRSGRALPYIVLLAALLLTVAATVSFAASARATDQLRFEREVQQTQSAIATRLEANLSLLRAAAGLFAASERVSRAEFHAYAEQLELRERYPGIQGIGFSRHLAPATPMRWWPRCAPTACPSSRSGRRPRATSTTRSSTSSRSTGATRRRSATTCSPSRPAARPWS